MHPNGDSFHSSWPLSDPHSGPIPDFQTVSPRLSEKPWRSLQRSSPGRLRGVFRPISPALHQPNSPPECCLYPFSDSLSETVRKASSAIQTPRHQTAHRYVDERFASLRQPLVVFAHPSVVVYPGERPLHYPPTW